MINRDIVIQRCLNRCSSVEFIVNEKCQNACKYCYRVKKHQLSPKIFLEPERLRLYINRIRELFGDSFFDKREIELFGGDAFLDYSHAKSLFKVLAEELREPVRLTIPTNARLLADIPMVDIEELLHILTDKGHKVGLSFSVDGIDDIQRRLSVVGKFLDYDQNYDITKLKALMKMKNVSVGYHPMFSFETIDKWAEQFEKFVDQNVTPYLLEVRHPLTNDQAVEAVIQLGYIRAYVDFIMQKRNYKDDFRRLFNTISASVVPRGLGCSAHTSLCVTIDGEIPFCHRLVDPPWIAANILTGEINLSRFVRYKMEFDHRNHPYCIVCPIRNMCSGYCVGASYEYWGDPWTPIQSVCEYLKLKAYVFSEIFADWQMTLYQSTYRYCYNAKDVLRQNVRLIFGDNVVSDVIRKITEKRDAYEKQL